MMPINILLDKVISQKVVDIEMIGAILEGHNWAISISSGIRSDCGDRWMCELRYKDRIETIRCLAPSLRTVIIEVLEKLIQSNKDAVLFNKEDK